jgi:phosphoribosyl-dephospho-CoA transferase
MTPEERFVRIEGVLQSTAEQQARHTEQIDKQNEGIRSLIVVARTCLDSIKEMRESHDADYKKLLESQATTDEKLHILIDTVDRIIRRESKEQ